MTNEKKKQMYVTEWSELATFRRNCPFTSVNLRCTLCFTLPPFLLFSIVSQPFGFTLKRDIHTHTLDRNDFALTSYREKCNGLFFFSFSLFSMARMCTWRVKVQEENKKNTIMSSFVQFFFFLCLSLSFPLTASSINKNDSTAQQGNVRCFLTS